MYAVDDLVFIGEDTQVHRVEKIDEKAIPETLFLVNDEWCTKGQLRAVGEMLREGEGPITLQISLATGDMNEDEARAKADEFLVQVKDIIAKAGLDPESIKMDKVEFVDDGV